MSDLNARTSPTSHASALVLIAEDEAEIADILIAYLQRNGLRTQHASDGQQALALHQDSSRICCCSTCRCLCSMAGRC
jgi:two-component system response regulator AdeR